MTAPALLRHAPSREIHHLGAQPTSKAPPVSWSMGLKVAVVCVGGLALWALAIVIVAFVVVASAGGVGHLMGIG